MIENLMLTEDKWPSAFATLIDNGAKKIRLALTAFFTCQSTMYCIGWMQWLVKLADGDLGRIRDTEEFASCVPRGAKAVGS